MSSRAQLAPAGIASKEPAAISSNGKRSGSWRKQLAPWLAPLALALSNTIGNVPAVILLLQVWTEPPAGALYALALLSTFAGNFLIVGSLANIITAERAAAVGVHLGFRDHAKAGVPITLLSMAISAVWLWALGVIRF